MAGLDGALSVFDEVVIPSYGFAVDGRDAVGCEVGGFGDIEEAFSSEVFEVSRECKTNHSEEVTNLVTLWWLLDETMVDEEQQDWKQHVYEHG